MLYFHWPVLTAIYQTTSQSSHNWYKLCANKNPSAVNTNTGLDLYSIHASDKRSTILSHTKYYHQYKMTIKWHLLPSLLLVLLLLLGSKST